MELKVPYVRQPADKPLCGPASATMVLKFFGHKTSFEQVLEELAIKGKEGLGLPRYASYFLEKKLEATIQMWPSGMAEKLHSKKRLEGEAALAALRRGKEESTRGAARLLSKELMPFVKRGGGIILKPLELEDFRTGLAGGALIVTQINMKCWMDDMTRKVLHFNIVRGVTDRDSEVSEPYLYMSDSAIGPELFVPVPRLLEACNSAYGSMLYVKRK